MAHRSPHRMLVLLVLMAAAAGCGKTLVDENGKNLIPTVCSCTAPIGGSPVCNPDGSCDYVCTGALLKCGGECIACSAPANAIPACVQGACGFACNSSTRLCPAAPGGAPTCQPEGDASCGPTCAPCPGPAAGPGRGVCQAGPAIGAGTCALVCDAGNHACGPSCFADDDAASCGASCQVCSAPANASPLCTGGACAFACNPGWMRCADGCCRAEAVAAGGEFACAILDDGGVRCWGANDRGQLGDGSTLYRPVPVDVAGLPGAPSRALTIAAGWSHACAVVSQGGQVFCWGDNTTGELGPAATGPFSPLPVPVTGVFGVPAPAFPWSPPPVAAGGGVSGTPPANFGHSCAAASGGLVCWGANGSGQLGDGSTLQSATPRVVSGISAASSVAAGERHTCAVSGGALRCWGANGSGQLGDGTTTASSTPRAVTTTSFPAGLPTFAAAARASSCAIVGTPAALFCWGDNAEGQVTTSPPPPATQLTPVAPSLGGGFSPGFVAAGRAHVCGLEPGSNTIKCFGANGQSQLSGAATVTGKNDVVLVGPAGGLANTVAAGGDHTCALLVDGSIQCWGANDRGQCGIGSTSAPVQTPAFVSGR